MSPTQPIAPLPLLEVPGPWPEALGGGALPVLEAALPAWLSQRRWFGGKGRPMTRIRILDAPAAGPQPDAPRIALAEVRYRGEEAELYLLPLSFHPGEPRGDGLDLVQLVAGKSHGVLRGADRDPDLVRALLALVLGSGRSDGTTGALVGAPAPALAAQAAALLAATPAPLSAEQSNTSFRLGDLAVLKLFRRTSPGLNPDLEIGAHLAAVGFPNVPPFLGGVEYRPTRGEPLSLAILQGFVPSRGDAWSLALAEAGAFLDRAAAAAAGPPPVPAHPLDAARAPTPGEARVLAGDFLDRAELLGRRTAELHRSLASRRQDAAFAPEPFRADQRRLQREVVVRLLDEALALLQERRAGLPTELLPLADRVLGGAARLRQRARRFLAAPVTFPLVRTHGDFHLGQVLWTGRDFVFLDFEGEPARSLSERRARRPAIRDVAGMLRSLQYAASQALADRRRGSPGRAANAENLGPWARAWTAWASAAFLRGWLASTWPASPGSGQWAEIRELLDLFLLEKAAYELVYELRNRPGWVGLPLEGLADLAAAERSGA